MEKRENEAKDQKDETQAAPLTEASAEAADDLDLDDLDLSVETVEERISPSETNVFDK